MIPSSSYTTLTNCIIVTVDGEDSFYPNGSIVIKDNKIESVGDSNAIESKGQIINLAGKLVMPGLINTHAHSPASLFRGLGDDLFLEKWLQEYMWPAEAHLTSDLAYAGASLSYLEYLQNGMTTNLDMWYFSKAVAKAAQRIGCRSFMSPGVSTKGSPENKNSFIPLEDFLASYKGRESETRIYPCVAPHDAYSCSREVLKKASAIAEQYGVLMHIHLSETQVAHDITKKQEGITPAQYMYECGVFDHRVVAAHCIHLEESDMKLFHDHNISISYNPVSNLKLCDGILPLKKILEYEINVTIGVDGAQSNNSLDLLSDIKTGSLIQKMKENDPTFFPASDAIRMMTVKGAKALGMDDKLGSLETGKLADIIAIDMQDCNLTPHYSNNINQLYSHIIYSANGLNVTDVWVDGEHILKNKKPTRVTKQDIVSAVQDAANYLSSIH